MASRIAEPPPINSADQTTATRLAALVSTARNTILAAILPGTIAGSPAVENAVTASAAGIAAVTERSSVFVTYRDVVTVTELAAFLTVDDRIRRRFAGAAIMVTATALVASAGAAAFRTGKENAPAVIGLGTVALVIGLQGIRTDCGWNAAIRISGRAGHWCGTLLAHCAGPFLGAMSCGFIVYGIGALAPIPKVAVVFTLIAVGAVRVFRPSTVGVGGWKVRRSWERLGTLRFMAIFGGILGLGFVTTMASPVFLAVVAGAVYIGQFYAVLFTLLCFAMGRVATTVLVSVRDTCDAEVKTANNVVRQVAWLGIPEGCLAVAVGLLLLY
jgi:hypothetical protein